MLNPVISPVVNGQQKIALQSKDGNVHEVISTPEKVDEFLKKRKNTMSNKLGFGVIGLGGVLGAIPGMLPKVKSPFITAGGAIFGMFLGLLTCADIADSRKSKLDQQFIDANA